MTLPPETERAIRAALASGLSPFRATPPMSLSEWAAENFRLSAEASHRQGAWQAYPFQKAMMDAMSNDDIREVSIRKARRIGYTKMLVAFLAYNAVHRRRKQALWQPSDGDRDSFVKTELEPAIRDIPVLAAALVSGRESDTLKTKNFLGGAILHTLGGASSRAYRRITVAAALLDEVDAFDQQIEKSADPVTLARGRLEGAPFPKLVTGSTPRIKGLSHVEYREANADAVMQYHIACPHCSVEHPLTWGGKDQAHGFKWTDDDPASVRHICPHCRGSITQGDYMRLWGAGEWVSKCGSYRYGQDGAWRDEHGDERYPPRHVAFVIWTAYSPQREWSDIVREFLEATEKARAGDVGPLMGFCNETLAETWEDIVERADEHELARRAEPYPLRTLPAGALVPVAGIDVQGDRFEIVVWALGRGEQMWAVDYAVIRANPGDEREWLKLDDYLAQPLRHENGRTTRVHAAAVDTAGHFTHHAYNYCRVRAARRIFAVKGDPVPGKPILSRASPQDVNWRGRVLKNGIKLWLVGTDSAKDLFFNRLKVKEPGPGYVHFSNELPDEFFEQLTAENRVPQRTARGIESRWVNRKGRRNEALDATVYSLFLAAVLDLHRYGESMWRRWETHTSTPVDVVETAPADVPAAETVTLPPPPRPPAPKRRVLGRMVPVRW